MSFYVISTLVSIFSTIICAVLLYTNYQKYLKNIGNKEVTIARLKRVNNTLQQIIENNEYDTNKDYNNIMFISSEKRIVLNDNRIKIKEQYTTDITKAKNFARYMNDYVEVREEDGE